MNNINKKVNVTAFGFKKNQDLYPQRIELDGKTVSFVDAGLSCTVQSDGKVSKIFTLSDGLKQFRLRSDEREDVWTLLSTSA